MAIDMDAHCLPASLEESGVDAANIAWRTGRRILNALILFAYGCTSSQLRSQDVAAATDTEPTVLHAVWQFDFFDTNNQSLGYLLLAFTGEGIDEPTCGNDYWKKMVVLEDRLDFDFGVESRPAYSINGPWLTIDLTASVCYIDHMLIGDITQDGATGFFNFSHKLGGYNIGKFTARPYSGARRTESGDVRG